MAALSIILVNYNERDWLESTLRQLESEFSVGEAEVIVVDNASTDGSVDMVRNNFPKVQCIATGNNLMYGKGNNEGLRAAQGEWLLLLNPDTQWTSGHLREFVAKAKHRTGISAPLLQYPDGRVQVSAHRRFPTPFTIFVDYCLPLQQFLLRTPWHPYLFSAKAHRHSQAIAHATGVCLLFPRSVYEKVGGFDPKFSMYLEETEWQKHAAGVGIERWLEASFSLTHFGSATKTFAQASPHYLWGLRLYVTKHWSGSGRGPRLLLALWCGTLVSIIVLVIGLIPSLFLGRKGRRIRHYFMSYIRLMKNLIFFPTKAPTIS